MAIIQCISDLKHDGVLYAKDDKVDTKKAKLSAAQVSALVKLDIVTVIDPKREAED